MLNVKVQNMKSGRSNKEVANQFIIEVWSTDAHDNGGWYFQSYDSVIAYRSHLGYVLLDEKYWEYSTTTGKYRNQFLCEDKKQTQEKIDAGIYKLVNLNA